MSIQGLTPELVAGVAEELDALRGWRVHAVHQDAPDRFRLALRGGSERRDLHVVVVRHLAHVALRAADPAPAEPSALASGMRGLIGGARLEGAHVVPGERALAIRFLRQGEGRTLWVEMFGYQANFYLVNEDSRVLLTPRGDVARRRGVSRGDLFEPVAARVPTTPAPDASAEIARMYDAQSSESALARLQTQARRALARSIKRTEGRIRRYEAMERRAADADVHRRRGELLQGAFHLLGKGQRTVRVMDYATDPPRGVELVVDPRLTPSEQVAACFREEKKCRRAGAVARGRLPGERKALAALERALEGVEEATSREAVAAALESVGMAAPKEEQKKPTAPAKPWRTFVSKDGWRILVGKHASGNDELTLRKARPQDLFLHVRAAGGSHVIVPRPREKTVPKETLLDAAELACHFSERRAAEHNEVDYVERRHVRKPKGSAPGLVVVHRAKVLSLRLDPARRERLLGSRAAPEE